MARTAIETNTLADGNLAKLSFVIRGTNALRLPDEGGIGGGSLTGAAVEANQFFALLATVSLEFTLALAKGPFLFHGAFATVEAVVFTGAEVFLLTSVPLIHDGTLTNWFVVSVYFTQPMLVAVPAALPIFASGAIVPGLALTIHALLRVSRHFALSAIETQSVAKVRLAMRSRISQLTLAFRSLGLVFLTFPAVLANVSIARRSVGKTGRSGAFRSGSSLRTKASLPLRRHRNAHLSLATGKRRLTMIDEILVLRVVLNDD